MSKFCHNNASEGLMQSGSFVGPVGASDNSDDKNQIEAESQNMKDGNESNGLGVSPRETESEFSEGHIYRNELQELCMQGGGRFPIPLYNVSVYFFSCLGWSTDRN